MSKWQGRSLKKASGGRIWLSRKKRKYELGRESVKTTIGEENKVKISVRGGGTKTRLYSVKHANITDPETGESKKSGILSVLENPADPNLARRSIINKGAVIETDVGKARITSRPGQEGTLNAVLIEGNLKKSSKEETEEEIEEENVKEENQKQ